MSAWREIASRVRACFGFGPCEEDLAAELQFHREMLEAQHRRAGLDQTAARRAARLQLGGEAQISESWRDQRSLPAFEMLRTDMRYGLRMLRRTPGFTLAAVLTLALGIGANTAIFTIVDAVLLRPLPYADPDRLVTIGDRTPDGSSSNVGFTTVVDWRARSRTFDTFALMRSWQPTLVTAGEAERVPAVRVSWNYFDMLGVRPCLGDRSCRTMIIRIIGECWQLTDSFLVSVVKSTGPDPALLTPSVRAVLRDLDPAVPIYDVATLEALVAKASSQQLFVMRLLGGFACAAVLLAAIGLYGVVSHGVAQRTREFGLRVALGAQRHDVVQLVLARGLALIAVGVAGGIAGALLSGQYLRTLVFGCQSFGPDDAGRGGAAADARCTGGPLAAGSTRASGGSCNGVAARIN